eukprot:2692565-Alexandrium_andersonii.AAC.1
MCIRDRNCGATEARRSLLPPRQTHPSTELMGDGGLAGEEEVRGLWLAVSYTHLRAHETSAHL